MNKTPVMELQELMVGMKNKGLPIYELTHNGGGTHINSFAYRVTCGDMIAEGSGPNKKHAKHEAARAMLVQMSKKRGYVFQHLASVSHLPTTSVVKMVPTYTVVKNISTMVQPVVTQPSSVPSINAVGKLQEICVIARLKEPIYTDKCVQGPPHNRVFTIQCRMGDIVKEGVAQTKKQAKHEAALKVLEVIQSCMPKLQPLMTLNTSVSQNAVSQNAVSETVWDIQMMDLKIEEPVMQKKEADELAMKRYPDLSKTPIAKTTSVLISDYHNHLRITYDDEMRQTIIESLSSAIIASQKGTLQSLELLKLKFRKILKSLNLCYERKLFTTESTKQHMVAIRLNTKPDIVEVGYHESGDLAEREAIVKGMKALMLLLK